jgi:hypothetical protein
MGLDMYAYTTDKEIPAVDFRPPKHSQELFYWRKHPNLHGWMEQLYRSKGGKARLFNCVPVRIDLNDLDALEQVVNADALPFTEGFFFGESEPDDKRDDLAFIQKARAAIADGDKVFYDSWW